MMLKHLGVVIILMECILSTAFVSSCIYYKNTYSMKNVKS